MPLFELARFWEHEREHRKNGPWESAGEQRKNGHLESTWRAPGDFPVPMHAQTHASFWRRALPPH
eukprot:14773901-Alexandrium_andersonii.AAC.1